MKKQLKILCVLILIVIFSLIFKACLPETIVFDNAVN